MAALLSSAFKTHAAEVKAIPSTSSGMAAVMATMAVTTMVATGTADMGAIGAIVGTGEMTVTATMVPGTMVVEPARAGTVETSTSLADAAEQAPSVRPMQSCGVWMAQQCISERMATSQ